MDQQAVDFRRINRLSVAKKPREDGQVSEATPQPLSAPSYPASAAEVYCFSIQPRGYHQPVEVAIKLGRRSIDIEAEASKAADSDRDFAREAAAFEALLPSLIPTRLGWFVGVLGGRVIDEDQDEIALAKRLEKTHRKVFVLIRRVSGDEGREYLRSPRSEFS